MLKGSSVRRFQMKMGRMYVDYKMLSRDHTRSVSVEEALVDVSMSNTIAPLHWLEALRSPTKRLPSGFFREERVYVAPPLGSATSTHQVSADGKKMQQQQQTPNAIRAGPIVLYIVGQPTPCVIDVDFVAEDQWPGMNSAEDCDLRVGLDAVVQCTLFNELRPGGLLTDVGISELKKQGGMVCGLAESPLVSRPHLRMKHMFIDELQRGPPLQEFIGHNPRVGLQWRFSQNCKWFRTGIWREITRKNELNSGLHNFSSWQKSPQQSVPEVRFMAPSP